MHLYKPNEDGVFYFRFRLNGKIYVRSTKTRNRQIAERAAYQFRDSLVDAVTNNTSTRGSLSLADGLKQYSASKKDQSNHRNLKAHIDFILQNTTPGLTFDRLSAIDVERLINKRREDASPATTKHTLGCLHAAHKHVKRLGYAVTTFDWPTVSVRNTRQRYLTPAEEAKFLAELDPNRTWTKMGKDFTDGQMDGLRQNYDIGVALLDTGGRLNEVLSMQWKDVNLSAKTIVLWRNKTNTGTTLTMTNRLFGLMTKRAANKKSDTWVFPGAGDKPAVSSGARIRKAIRRAGLTNFRVHDIRHSFASKLIQNGLSLYEVASALGHSSPSTSARYAHLEKQAVADKAAGVLNALASK